MRTYKIFIRSTSIDRLIDGSPNVGGIAVQLYFWAQALVDSGHKVYALTSSNSCNKQGIRFIKYRNWKSFDIVHEWLNTAKLFIFNRPDIVIVRGAGRSLYPVAVLSKIFHIRLVLFGASDVNFEPGKELISGKERYRRLFQKAIPLVPYIVTQNKHQHDTLLENYGKDSMVLPNIWGATSPSGRQIEPFDVVWVANMRSLKRPEWIIEAAMALPQYRFAMVGGADNKEKEYYEQIKEKSAKIPNLIFWGCQPFLDTCDIVGSARVLSCTSEFEGFPNTFLQAWAKGIPVISTVDPNNVVYDNRIGCVVDNKSQFVDTISNMLDDELQYAEYVANVKAFFSKNYSAKSRVQELLNYINI